MRVWELLAQMERAPGMYLMEPSISHLGAFIDGWMFASGESEDHQFLCEFQDWVVTTLDVPRTLPWNKAIEISFANSYAAVPHAFRLINEYRHLCGGRAGISNESRPE